MSEVSELETVPEVQLRLVADLEVVFLHYHQPQVNLVLAIVISALEILSNLKTFVEHDISQLIETILHCWIVWIPIVFWSSLIMVFSGEHPLPVLCVFFQDNNLYAHCTSIVISFH